MSKNPEVTVSAIIFNPDGKILLCKSHKWGNKFVIPGGHIEYGEKMEDALKREIMEETGLNIYDIKLVSLKESIFSDTFYKKKHLIFIDFQCKTDSRIVSLNDEAHEYAWIDIKQVDNYDLGGSTRELLVRLRDKDGWEDSVKVFYNY